MNKGLKLVKIDVLAETIALLVQRHNWLSIDLGVNQVEQDVITANLDAHGIEYTVEDGAILLGG